ncbi:MAG: helix-turn-helix domain-containing protein [Candidatus Oleimicrobiaceae bacterium]
MIRESSSFDLRLEMVGYAEENGIGKTGRHYRTTRLAVRKWIRKYKEEGLSGLRDKPRAPPRIPHKRSKETEGRVIELRKTHPAWGHERIKMHYELPTLAKAIGRMIRRARRIRKRKKKRRRKRKR